MPTRLTSFLSTVRQLIASPGGLVIAIAAAVCFLPFFVGLLFVTPSSFASSFHKYVAKSPWDDRVFGYAKAAALSMHHSNESSVVLVGSSSMRAAFDSDTMEDEVFKLAGIQHPVYNLAVSDLSIMEYIGMIEHIPVGSAGYLLLKVSPTSLTTDYSSEPTRQRLKNLDRFTLQSESLVREMQILGIRNGGSYGNFFLDNIAVLAARYKRISLNLLQNQKFDVEHRYLNKGNIDQTRWNIRGLQVVKALSRYDENKDQNLDYIRSLVAHVRQRTSMDIVLVEQLFNPQLLSQYISPSFYARYQQDINELADNLDISYLDLPKHLELAASDFYDWTHINTASAIDKASRYLVNHIYSASNQDLQ